MPNTSATGGALTPSPTPAPLYDEALADFFQAWIVGITNIAPTLVRPRWQPEPLNIPAAGIDWIAFGVSIGRGDVFAAELHFPAVNGYNEVRRHEELTVKASFYGPNGGRTASLLREGVSVAQNREVLSINNMGLIECGDIVSVPEFVKMQWYQRSDMQLKIRRQIVRAYPVQTLLSAELVVENETESFLIITP